MSDDPPACEIYKDENDDVFVLEKAFMCIKDANLRRAIVRLVEEITPETA